MSLELIIQEIKAIGNIMTDPANFNQQQQQTTDLRRYRVKIGDDTFISKRYGSFVDENQLIFQQPFSYVFEHSSHMLYIQIFKQHHFLDNSDLDYILNAEIDLSDFTNLNGDYIETKLHKNTGEVVGKLIVLVETFKKGQKYYEKVSSKLFFEAVKDEKQRQIQASEAAKNIKNLMVNNTLADTLMTINAMTLICEKEDNQIFMKQGFILIKYGMQIKAYSSLVKILMKQSANWVDYIEFLKNQGVKFEFFFFHYDQLGNLILKAKGEIKYVIFDETINLHSIQMFDKRSVKYGTLMVKFIEKIVDKVNISNKIDKKIKDLDPFVQNLIEEYNQFRFENKNNNHILSEKLWELERLEKELEEQKSKPLNPEEKKKQNQHVKFIDFMQKQMIKIERQLAKREQHDKKDGRKNKFLPTVHEKKGEDSRVKQDRRKKMNSSNSAHDFTGLKLPKI